MSVPWHRSLVLRLFALGAVVAIVAVAAATWATVRATSASVHQEQQQSLHADASAYDALIGYAATHRSWKGAARLVSSLARDSGHTITITDDTGRVLLTSDTTRGGSSGRSSGGSPGATSASGSAQPAKKPISQARATLDALSVDPVLLATSTPPSEQAVAIPSPVPGLRSRCDRGPCSLRVPAPASTIDPRVLGPFAGEDRHVWSELTQRVRTCLARAGSPAEITIDADFSAEIATPGRDDQAATRTEACIETARRTMLTPYVAPRALLFIGDSDPTADVLWDLSAASKGRIALLAAAVLGLTLLLSAALAGYVVRPLRVLAAAARRAGEGDLSVRVDESRRDEIGEMAQAFNVMAERREQLEEARRRMVSDVSHELRNPLATIRGWIEAAQDGIAANDAGLLASLHEETTHLQRLVDDLHDLSVGDAGELRLRPEPIEVEAFVRQVRDGFAGAAASAGVTLTAAAEPGAHLTADPVRLRQAVGNLVVNALRHTPAGGRIAITGTPGTITVGDTGEGIAVEELPYVFERFRRVDASRSRATGGSGLGLAIVRQIVEAHGGSAHISSTPGAGTTVTLRLG